MRLSAIALVIALSIVSAARCAAATEGESGGGTPPGGDQIDPEKLEAARREAIAKSGIQPREDEEVSRLIYRVASSGLEARAERMRAVLALDRERVLAALAHGILDMEYGRRYVNFVARHLPDERLVPFLAARIRLSQGVTLNSTLTRLRWAPNNFLRGLVPVLIEHALDSDYEGRGGPSVMTRSWSALAETTRLLDEVTEGKTGIEPVSSGEVLGQGGEARKAQVRAAWRTWWEENKAEWEAETKREEEAPAPPQPPVPTGPIEPRDDEEVSRLLYQWGSGGGPKFTRALLKMDRERVFAALAFKIPDPAGGYSALHFALMHLPDRRLVPFIAARIRSCTDEALLYAVQSLQSLRAMPDRDLVGPLIEHALQSDYEGRGVPRFPPNLWSVLADTTKLLDTITEGKTGIKPVRAMELLSMDEEKRKAKKEELRAAWRKWWEENKAEWEAGPKPEEEAPARDSGSPSEGRPADTQAAE